MVAIGLIKRNSLNYIFFFAVGKFKLIAKYQVPFDWIKLGKTVAWRKGQLAEVYLAVDIVQIHADEGKVPAKHPRNLLHFFKTFRFYMLFDIGPFLFERQRPLIHVIM